MVLDKNTESSYSMSGYTSTDGYGHSSGWTSHIYFVSFEDASGHRFVGTADAKFFTMVVPGDIGILYYKTWNNEILCCNFQSMKKL